MKTLKLKDNSFTVLKNVLESQISRLEAHIEDEIDLENKGETTFETRKELYNTYFALKDIVYSLNLQEDKQ